MITVNKKDLVLALSLAPRSLKNLPITGHALIQLTEQLTISATNLEVTSRVTVPFTSDESVEPVSTTAEIKTLLKTVRACSDLIQLEVTEQGVTVGGVKLQRLFPASDFPKLPEFSGDSFSASAPTLLRMLKQVEPAASEDETRKHLNCILFTEDDGLSLVATNGHWLAQAFSTETAPQDGFLAALPGIPKLKQALTRTKAAQCKIGVQGNRAFFRLKREKPLFGNAAFTAELVLNVVDAQFPPYQRLFSDSWSREVTVDRKSITAALKRCKAIFSEVSISMLVVERDKLTVKAEHDLSSVTETLVAKVDGENEEPFKISFNAQYLLDILSAEKEDQVTLRLGDHNLDPMTVIGGQFIALIMPTRM